MKRILLLFVSIFFLANVLHAQSSLDSLLKRLPKLSASLKYNAEYDVEDNQTRFIVKSARIAAKGDANQYFDYILQIDFNAFGNFQVLDLAAGFKPVKNLKFNAGQIKIPYSSNYVITPSEIMFANATYAALYMNGSSRDIGVSASYTFATKIPIELEAGVFNGSGIKNPRYEEIPGYAARAVFGKMQGYRASVKYYQQNATGREKIQRYGADARYGGKNFRIEGEASFRRIANTYNDWTYYAESGYRFDLKKKGLVKYIEPVVRWDDMLLEGKMIGVIQSEDSKSQRFSAGINFGFDIKPMACEFRINYDTYWNTNIENAAIYNVSQPSDFNNKLIFELLLKF